MQIDSAVPAVAHFSPGSVVTLAIHSPSLLFAGDPTIGKIYDFSLARRVESGSSRFVGLTLSIAHGAGAHNKSHGYESKNGFVPDSQTAVKIAEAVLISVYGEEQIRSEEPFTGQLKGDVWTVGGTLRCPDGKGGFTTTDCVGGVAVVKLSKADGRILFMMHYK